MNYFAHGLAFVDDPYLLAGTAIPDWLNVSDRRVRVRSRHAECFCNDADPRVAALARGIAQHHHDDGWFHATAAFAELCWQFTADIRALVGRGDDFRPSFLGHILVELLLDAELIAADPARLEQYYQAMNQIDPCLVEQAVCQMAPNPASRLAWFIPLFVRERFLFDYTDDAKLCFRLGQVLRRVNLPPLPPRFIDFIPSARALVAARQPELLARPAAAHIEPPSTLEEIPQ